MRDLKFFSVIAVLVFVSNVVADNQQFECTDGSEKRIISVVYEQPNQNVPCRVDYERYGVVESLWNAKSTVGYCEEKANIFLEKQRELGFVCDQMVLAPE